MKTALIAGATGLVGQFLLEQLAVSSEYSEIKILIRKPLPNKVAKVKEIIIDYEHIEDFKDQIHADDYFCCLGTTIKAAKSQENFRKVDYEYVFRLACLAREHNCQHFAVVSAMGADFSSPLFYNKVKGQMESALMDLGFNSLLIFRPSLLLGPRKETRWAEKLASLIVPILNPIMLGPIKKYRAIQAKTVAQAMVLACQLAETGPHVYLSSDIEKLAMEMK